MADLLLTLLAKDELSSVFGNASGAVTVFAKSLVEMTKQAAESERIQAQLKLAAGQYTDALRDQAQAMSAKLGVDDDQIMQMQTILARYGEAPGKIKETTKAILDYAAATGKDAVQATEDMVKAADKGTGAVKSMGISFDSTGKFAGDLEAATKALGARYHNGSEVNAETLVGQFNAAKVAIEDLGKVFGATIGKMIKDSGALQASTAWLRGLSYAAQKGKVGTFLGASVIGAFGSEMGANITAEVMSLADKETEKAGDDAGKSMEGIAGSTRDTVKEGKGGTAALEHKLAEQERIAKMYEQRRWQRLTEDAKREDDLQEEQTKRDLEDARQTAEDAEERVQQRKKMHERIQQETERAAAAEARAMERQQAMFARAGDRLGAGFVDAFVNQVSQLASGGEFDVGGFFGSLFEGIFGFAASLIPGVGILEGAARSAITGIGRLAGGGMRAATRRHHDGGWIESFHGGGWPAMGGDEQPAILQSGERVLSRQEVRRMGGQQGVDRAARGGGSGVNFYVNAVDQESIRQMMEGRGGRAIVNAVRLGRGPLPALIKG